jgi:hypothetical protein
VDVEPGAPSPSDRDRSSAFEQHGSTASDYSFAWLMPSTAREKRRGGVCEAEAIRPQGLENIMASGGDIQTMDVQAIGHMNPDG